MEELQRSYSRSPLRKRRRYSPNGWGRKRRRDRRKVKRDQLIDNGFIQNAIVAGDGNEFFRDALRDSTAEEQQEVYNVVWKLYDTIISPQDGMNIFDLISLIQNVIQAIEGVWMALVESGQRTIDAFVNMVIFTFFTLVYTVRAIMIINPFMVRSVAFVSGTLSTLLGFVSSKVNAFVGVFSSLNAINVQSIGAAVGGFVGFIPRLLQDSWITFQNQWNYTSDTTRDNSLSLSQLYDLTLEYLSVVDPNLRVIFPYLLSMVMSYFEVDQDTTYNTLDFVHMTWSAFYSLPNGLYALLGMPDATTGSFISLCYNYGIWIVSEFYEYLIYGLAGGVLNFVGLRVPELSWPNTTVPSGNTDGDTDPGVDYSTATIFAAVRNLDYVPDHVGIVLQTKAYDPSETGAPDLASLREVIRRVRSRNRSQEEEEELRKRNYERRLEHEKRLRQSFDEQEKSGVIKQAADAIIWCLVAGIPILTLYEESGFLEQSQHKICNKVNETLKSLDVSEFAWDGPLKFAIPGIGGYFWYWREGMVYKTTASVADGPDGLLITVLSGKNNYLTNVAKAAQNASRKAMEGSVGPESLSEQELIKHTLNSLTGLESMPGLLILTESGGSTLGFPLYALKMTLV